MIYLVTNAPEIFDNESYKVISVEESLQLLEPLKKVGVDTETEGFDVYKNKLLLAQFGCPEFQVVVDCRTVDIREYKTFLESKDRLFLFWNAKFDLKFFLHAGIVITNVYDGYLAEKLMWLGYPPGYHELSLKAAGITYLGVELDKSVRGKIFYAGLATDVIVYSAHDVKYLEPIMDKQLSAVEAKDLLKALDFENKFVVVLAYIEYCGVKLDTARWQKKMAADAALLNKKESMLNDWVVDFYKAHTTDEGSLTIDYYFAFEKVDLETGKRKKFTPEGKFELLGKTRSYETSTEKVLEAKIRQPFPYVTINLQGDLWEGFDTEPKCCINWNSAKQVIPLFELLGFNLNTFDKATGKSKKSIDAKIIEPQKSISSIAPVYLEYKAAQKIVSTYGENLLKQVNVDGRIHTQFNQLMDTGYILPYIIISFYS